MIMKDEGEPVGLGAGRWKLGDGSWEMEVGSWKLEDGSWKLVSSRGVFLNHEVHEETRRVLASDFILLRRDRAT
jgi:hypothetical protein